MIPKIIHYCWFGGAPLPPLVESCIQSWKKFCPDYTIIEWNEDNYCLEESISYVREAVEAKRWAFATDYIRLDVVYRYGGIYLDTDVELLKNLDPVLINKVFFARDQGGAISTGLGFGAEQGCECVRKLRDDYHDAHFRIGPVSYDLKPCPERNKIIFDQYGFSEDSKKIEIREEIVVYPQEYFSPKSYQTSELKLTENTYSIHHFGESWKTSRELNSKKRREFIVGLFGQKAGMQIAKVLNSSIGKVHKLIDYLKRTR